MYPYIVLSKWCEAQTLVQPTVAGNLYYLLKVEYILMGW